MEKLISFDDVLIRPIFSHVKSRADVSLTQTFLGRMYELPIISANMDSVTGVEMAKAMYKNGGEAVLHRFSPISTMITDFLATEMSPYVSFGIGETEFSRVILLDNAGATHFVLDVAHAAAIHVVEQYERVRKLIGDDKYIVVGNFATKEDIESFNYHCKTKKPDAFKVGIGAGSACTTRIVTGCGIPMLSSVIDCVKTRLPIIADGGMKNSGDISKALAAGAKMVMLGGMLAGTDESPGEKVYKTESIVSTLIGKKYRGSASKSSYINQGKEANHRTAEGEEFIIPYKGPVSDVLQQIKAGIRSSMSYTNSFTLQEFRENAKLVQVSTSSIGENKAHGDKK